MLEGDCALDSVLVLREKEVKILETNVCGNIHSQPELTEVWPCRGNRHPALMR